MTPHKITITIHDKADCSSCDVSFHFEPPYREDEPATPALRAMNAAYAGIRAQAKSLKATDVEWAKKKGQ